MDKKLLRELVAEILMADDVTGYAGYGVRLIGRKDDVDKVAVAFHKTNAPTSATAQEKRAAVQRLEAAVALSVLFGQEGSQEAQDRRANELRVARTELSVLLGITE